MGDSLTPLTVDRQIQSRWCSLMVWLKLWVRSPSCITHKVHTLEYGMVRWGSPETPSHTQMIMMKEMKYIIEFLSFAVLTLACLYGFIILMVMI